MMISSAVFSIVLKILIIWVVRGVKGQNMTLNDLFQSVKLYISGTVDHIIKIFATQL